MRLLLLQLVATASAAQATAAAAQTTAAAAQTPPNYLVIFVDDMGLDQVDVDAGDLYGYTGDGGRVSTPGFARLADEGMVFQTWYAAAALKSSSLSRRRLHGEIHVVAAAAPRPASALHRLTRRYSAFHVCSPSRGALLTGRHPVRLGLGATCGPTPKCEGQEGSQVFSAEAVGGLPFNETTTAEALKTAGYATGLFGKWHVGQRPEFLPTKRGFDEYFGIPFSQDMGLSSWIPNNNATHPTPQPKEPGWPTPLPLLANETVVEQPVDLSTLTQRYARWAGDFMKRRSAAAAPWSLRRADDFFDESRRRRGRESSVETSRGGAAAGT